MRILFIGDVFGKPGRQTVAKVLPRMKAEQKIDLVLANAENTHHGKGVTDSKIRELTGYGIDFFTAGNHVWRVPEIYPFLDQKDYPLIRPANYPDTVPGRGYGLVKVAGVKNPVAVINLMGRVFMPAHLDDPFKKADQILDKLTKDGLSLGKGLAGIIVDFHAETGSEKVALAYYLDGRVSAVLGTHTHIQTADERVLEGGTAYLTDLGMVGVIESSLGVRKEEIIENFLTQLPVRHQIAEGNTMFCAALIDLNEKTGLAEKIERIQIKPVSV
jgi:metallophosphoesterase (TIGR00282 family)